MYTRPNPFPPVIKNLIIINGLIFMAQMLLQDKFPVNETFALHDFRSHYFKPWQILTHMFMHGGFEHLIFNMFSLWFFGSKLENVWGGRRFLTFYLVCGYGAALLYMGVRYVELTPYFDMLKTLPFEQQMEIIYQPNNMLNVPMLGASGAIFGLLAAYGYLFPNTVIYMNFFFPLKAKWYVLITAFIEIRMGIINAPGDSVAHFAHIGGALAGIILVLIWNKTNRKTFY